jgi:hypothetical protein
MIYALGKRQSNRVVLEYILEYILVRAPCGPRSESGLKVANYTTYIWSSTN